MAREFVDARELALDWLDQVLVRRRPLDEVAGAALGGGLASRDRAFARLLAVTTLRRLGEIDHVIDHYLARPLPPRARAAQMVLRLGVCQLLFLATPDHAAVDSSVKLAAACGAVGYRKLVNAILRRVARARLAPGGVDETARLNVPDWLWQSWAAAYGSTVADAIAKAHLEEPPLDLTPRGAPDALAPALGARRLPTGTLRRPGGGAVVDLPGFEKGEWWVQDAAAALPAKLLGAGVGAAVIDLCAAPGGKTAQFAAAGAHVTAVDRSPKRLARLGRNLARLRLDATLVEADAATWRPPRPALSILLDAPCTGTGTIRRHPDIQHLKSAADVARTAAVQDRLLANAAAMLAPGGVLVYSVCSLQPEEGPERVAALLARDRRLVRRPIGAAEVGGLEQLVNDVGDLRTLPCHLPDQGGLDGFYAARIVRAD